MKAVIYHADAKKQFSGITVDGYKPLFEGFMENAHRFGIQVVHCTLAGFPCWGDEGFYTDGLDPEQIVLNREICFSRFLEQADPAETYLFVEPDARIRDQIPPLVGVDCAMLYRNDPVHMTPAFRLATKAALPLFIEIRDRVHKKFTSWDGDSWACNSVYEEMGNPKDGDVFEFRGVKVELRRYKDYNSPGGKYVQHFKWTHKKELLAAEGH